MPMGPCRVHGCPWGHAGQKDTYGCPWDHAWHRDTPGCPSRHPDRWPQASPLSPRQSPAYTLVWTRQNHGTLPAGAVDFNGILTLRNVRPEDAGVYVCTGSNMLDMDEGTATLYVQGEPAGRPDAGGDGQVCHPDARGTGVPATKMLAPRRRGDGRTRRPDARAVGALATRTRGRWAARRRGDGHVQCPETRVMGLPGAQMLG